MSRPIQVPWTCLKSGDCCRQTTEVRVTLAERVAMEQAAPTSGPALAWVPDADPHFVRLTAHPCPFVQADNSCAIYESRPLTCRQFMCGRVSTEEAYQPDRLTGCANLTDRLESSERFRQHYATNGRKTMQRWGREHGWTR